MVSIPILEEVTLAKIQIMVDKILHVMEGNHGAQTDHNINCVVKLVIWCFVSSIDLIRILFINHNHARPNKVSIVEVPTICLQWLLHPIQLQKPSITWPQTLTTWWLGSTIMDMKRFIWAVVQVCPSLILAIPLFILNLPLEFLSWGTSAEWDYWRKHRFVVENGHLFLAKASMPL